MAICNDCIHARQCVGYEPNIDERCDNFKNKADFVEVVRCKDCKHYVDGMCYEIYYIMDSYYRDGFEVKQPNDFCSYGEKKA